MNGYHHPNTEVSTSPSVSIEISDDYDPTLQMAELEVRSQNSGQLDEFESYRQFGITRYIECKFLAHHKICIITYESYDIIYILLKICFRAEKKRPK